MIALQARLNRLHAYSALLQARDYRLLFTGQAISQLGDWMNRVALIVLVYRLTGRQVGVALVMLALLLPRAFVFPFGGVLADRYPKRRLMLATDLVRALLAAVPVFVTTARGLWCVGLAVVAMQALSGIFNPARSAAIPALVSRDDLGLANALNGLSMQTAFFIGPVIGTAIIAIGDLNGVFIVNAVTFLISALVLWRMRLVEPPRAGAARGSTLSDLREGWAIVGRDPTLRVLFGVAFLGSATAISLNVLLVALLAGPLQRPASQIGLLLTIVGLGTILGLASGLRLLKRFPAKTTLAVIGVLLVLDLALIGAARSFAVVALALVINGVLSGASDLIYETTVGQTVEASRLGRVFGLLFWTATLGHVIGAIAGGVLPLVYGASGAVLVLSVIFAAVIASVLLLNSISTQPDCAP
ncbi:MAG: MFS transporter [Thermomicrobiales bacterium]